MKNKNLKNLVFCGVFTALISVLSIISIPMPSGVPITLQTFIIAFTGFVLGKKWGVVSVLAYIVIGAIGVPVFSGLRGGLGVLAGYTGGFIFGFIVFVILCGILREKFAVNLLLAFAGLAVCHLFGTVQYALLSQNAFIPAFLLVSAPYLIKDILSVLAAKLISVVVIKNINKKF